MEYTYNGLGQKTQVTTYSADSTGRTTTYEYDQQGHVEKIVYPYTSAAGDLLWNEYYQYDVNGSLVAKLVGMVNENTDEITDGDVTAYEYDTLGRLTKVDYDYTTAVWPVSSITISTADVSYTYDSGTGLKTQMVDGSGTSSYTYDTQGRLATYTPPVPSQHAAVEYEYNNLGQKISVESGDYDVEYEYFKNGWLKNVKTDSGTLTLTAYTYDVLGNRTRIDYGNSNYTLYEYNDLSGLESIDHYTNSGTISIGYPTRDGNGNPLTIDDTDYIYDENSRLTGEDAASFDYDWVGNRLNPPANPNPMVYNKVDQLTSWPSNYSYTYYDDGGMHEELDTQQQVVRHYTYHPSGLLNEATYPNDGELANTWDADGNRVGLYVDDPDRGSASYTFVYDVTAGIPAVVEEDDGTTAVYYYREPSGALIASRIGEEGWRYYHFDELGSTRAITDIYGDVVDTYEYDAWGNLTNWQCLDLQPYMYVGQLGYYTHYQTADLYGQPKFQPMQLGVRFYDPEIGRFTQRDGVGTIFSTYGYVKNRPTMRVDANGMYELDPKSQPVTYPYHWLPAAIDIIQGAAGDPVCADALKKAGVFECVTAPELDGITFNLNQPSQGGAGETSQIPPYTITLDSRAPYRTVLHELVHSCRLKANLYQPDEICPWNNFQYLPGEWTCPDCGRSWNSLINLNGTIGYPYIEEQKIAEDVVHKCLGLYQD